MSVVAEADAKADYNGKYDRKAYRTDLYKAEAKEEYEIKDREDNGEPGIFIHHGKAQKVEYPALFRELDARCRHKDAVDQNVYIEGERWP